MWEHETSKIESKYQNNWQNMLITKKKKKPQEYMKKGFYLLSSNPNKYCPCFNLFIDYCIIDYDLSFLKFSRWSMMARVFWSIWFFQLDACFMLWHSINEVYWVMTYIWGICLMVWGLLMHMLNRWCVCFSHASHCSAHNPFFFFKKKRWENLLLEELNFFFNLRLWTKFSLNQW